MKGVNSLSSERHTSLAHGASCKPQDEVRFNFRHDFALSWCDLGYKVVGGLGVQGLEPWTRGLKGRCSTD